MSWAIAALGEVAKIERKSIAPSGIKTGTKYVGLEHIESGGGALRFGFVSAGELASNKFEFNQNHVLFGKLRPYLAKIVSPDFAGICSTDILPILPSIRIDQGYLLQFLRHPKTVEWASSRAIGINLPRLSPKQLEELQIPLPPLDEQRRIAAILDKADALRRKRKRALDLLDSLPQSIFLEMFGKRCDPTSSVQHRTLGELAELINGDRSSNYPSGDDIVNSGILFLNTTNITPEGLDLSTANYITEKKFASLSRGKLLPGDIVITLRGSLGQTAIFENAGKTGFINAQMMIIRPKKEINARYLLQFFQLDSTLALLKKIGSGSAVPQLTAKQIFDLAVPVPHLQVQRKFADRRQAIHKLRRLAIFENNNFDSLFASLQHRAFSGHL